MNVKPGEYMITNLNRPCVECQIVDTESKLLHHKPGGPMEQIKPIQAFSKNKVNKGMGENVLFRNVEIGTKTSKSCNNYTKGVDRISDLFEPLTRVDSNDKFGVDTRMLAKKKVRKY